VGERTEKWGEENEALSCALSGGDWAAAGATRMIGSSLGRSLCGQKYREGRPLVFEKVTGRKKKSIAV